jgi:hypothetical protein
MNLKFYEKKSCNRNESLQLFFAKTNFSSARDSERRILHHQP